jgi:alkylation response protein AidB-like acyl-CoA dehydrogenase
MSVNNSLVCYGIEAYGTEEQKQKWLRPLARGEKIGAFLLSEPEAGSDATSQRTTAVDKGDHYLVNGVKNWITSGNSASTYVLIAQTHPDKGHRGLMLLSSIVIPLESAWDHMRIRWACAAATPIL